MQLDKEQKLEQLERLLQSRTLQHSESLKAFLRFVVERTVAEQEIQLKEYIIATEVFGRNSDYDPRIDSVVRVQAGRLRTKLQEYYATEGKSDQIVIDLPKGHYHPVFTYACPEAQPELAVSHAVAAHNQAPDDHLLAATSDIHTSVVPAPVAHTQTIRLWVLSVIIVALVVAVLVLALSNRELRRAAAPAQSLIDADEIRTVWGAFINDPEPPLLVLSNPAVYRFVNKADPNVLAQRAIRLNDDQARTMFNAPEFKGQWVETDAPQLIPSLGMYTGMGEAIGLYRLTGLFGAAHKEILLKQSRQVSAADLKYRNVILLGSIYVNEWSRKLPINESFVYTYSATIENHQPQAGEEREYRPQFNEQTGELKIDYALVTVRPNISGENDVMILAGIYSEGTEAAAEFVTTRNHLATLTQGLQQLGGKDGPPRYYQALLKVGVENGTPTTITLIALHPLRAS
ncbi:MAG: hypothetical protein DMF64_09450 [Acidobacteria bacterium]|nr:MAG: hypothetical protein DMF64_09450 [Acidobacteriota bacterium]